MTLQQLKYVIAVNRYRNFAKAANACAVTQPTLSAMLSKLEAELNVKVFERNNRNVIPTPIGIKIIKQAEKTVADAAALKALVTGGENSLSGELNLAAGPTISPYILPEFIQHFSAKYPHVQLRIQEMKISSMLNMLLNRSIDAGIGIAGNMRKGILEIPLYFDPVVAYVVDKGTESNKEFIWVMKEAISLRESAFSFYKAYKEGCPIYEASNLETLIHMVDTIGGRTVIPKMHLKYLTPEQLRHVVEPEADQTNPVRHFSLYVKSDFISEKMLRSLLASLRRVIPPHLQEQG